MRTLIAILLLLTLTACASTRPDPNYLLYRESVQAAQAAEVQRLASISDAAQACNGDATCVVSVAGFAALAAQGGGRAPQLQQYQRQRGAAESITLGVLGALPGLAQVYATVDAGRRNVDIARIGAEREVGIANAWAGVTTGVADAFAGQGPSTYVGGDLISGTQHIGDWVGRDNAGRDQRTGDDVRRDTIGGDRTDFGTGNRFDSPGPWRDSPNCTGDQCQGGDRNPAPEPEPEGEG
jgi:hypothetical protein